VSEIRTGTATYDDGYGGSGKSVIDSQKEVGGGPELHSKPAPTNANQIGMPDDGEKTHQLDPNIAADDGSDTNHDSQTHLEEYLNSLVPHNYPVADRAGQ